MIRALEYQETGGVLPKVSFYAAFGFLTTAAVSIHWVGENALTSGWWLLVLPPLWVFIVLLAVLEFSISRNRTVQALRLLTLVSLVPAFRLSVSPGRPGWIWLPLIGWRQHGRELVRTLERNFATPMLIIAGLMLPIIMIELFWPSAASIPEVQIALNVATGAIWMAFTIEFIVMISVSNAKAKYCLTHWLDIVIIILPLVSYLRAVRMVKLGKIAKTMRAYRMRSLTHKVFRGAATADLVGRLLRRSPEKRIAHLREQVRLHREEIAELEQRIDLFERGKGE